MNITDYVIDILLIAVVVLQMRPRPQTWQAMLRPLILVAVAGFHFLRPVHLGGVDVALVALLTGLGVMLGASSGLATRLWRQSEGVMMAQADVFAAFLWVAGMGFRFAFAIYASTDSGGAHLARFSVLQHITGAQVWTTALVLMAFGEVLARVGYLQWRAQRLRAGRRVPVPF